ncbi:MAG: chloride channel protein, partial [Oscillospiraceae bacterium]|nr:chloride channel protein [Oscillospiraceae bacterium]
GEVVPSFFVGAVFGCVMGPLLGIPAGFAAALSLVAVFCSAVNCPLASIFLSVELFGADGILYFALACGLSFVLSGYNGLYSSQRILYDKLKAQYINVYANAHHEGEITETEMRYR